MEINSSYLLTFLLNSLWLIPLFTLVAIVVTWAMRNGPASHRHAVWVAALISSLAMPIVSAVQNRTVLEPLPGSSRIP